MEMIKNAINVKLLKLLDEMEEYEPGSFLRESGRIRGIV